MNKTKSIRVRLTDEEWTQAESVSLLLFGETNKSRLIRKLLRDYIGFGPDFTHEELNEFRQAVRQLTGIARNLNQITTKLHQNEQLTNRFSNDYLQEVLSHVIEVNDSLKNYIMRTITRYQEAVNHDHYE